MTTAIAQSWHMTTRHLRFLSRQPWLISISLVQPVIWLLLFGQLFKRVVEIPGFAAGSYITFLTPGVVVMTAV
ncbi:MAG TPA: ABC transporter permease, partial [Actinomycetes bacterium]